MGYHNICTVLPACHQSPIFFSDTHQYKVTAVEKVQNIFMVNSAKPSMTNLITAAVLEVKSVKKNKRQLKFVREEILIAGDMHELTHGFDLLTMMGNNLASHPDLWELLAADPLTYYRRRLVKAYIALEGRWRDPAWQSEDDHCLTRALGNYRAMRQYIKIPKWVANPAEKRGGHYIGNDPSLIECGECLCLVLELQQARGGKKWIDKRINSLRNHLTSYAAAVLYELRERRGVFSHGRPAGAVSDLHQILKQVYDLQRVTTGRWHDFESFWTYLQDTCTNNQNCFKNTSLKLQSADEEYLNYILRGVERMISKSAIRNKFRQYKIGKLDKYLANLWKALPIPLTFDVAWQAIINECRNPPACALLVPLKINANFFYYREGNAEISIPQAEILRKFQSFIKKIA
ncbi:MAG: hypothetical protein ABI167_13300 [Nitrosospira sp.]